MGKDHCSQLENEPEKGVAVKPGTYTCKITKRMCVAASNDGIDPELIDKFPPNYDSVQAQRCPCYNIGDAAAQSVIDWIETARRAEAEFVASVYRTY
jgi:hypothetical protein